MVVILCIVSSNVLYKLGVPTLLIFLALGMLCGSDAIGGIYFDNYEIAKNRINILKRSVDSAQNVLDSYTRLFLAGKRQWLDLVNASREVMQYKIELSNLYVTKSILSYKLALKNGQIDLLTGEIK